jgi:hypothetical protein
MPRPIKYLEFMVARFPTGTFDRIAAVLTSTEDRADFVRAAVERELKRREHAR